MNGKKPVLVTTWFGSFLLKGKDVLDERLFPKDPGSIAERRMAVKEGKVLQEEDELASQTDEKILVNTKRLSSLGEVTSMDVEPPSPKDRSYGMGLLQEALRLEGKEALRGSVERDKHLAKAVDAIQDLNETLNILTERIGDWYSLHYPELVDREDEMLELIKKHGDRDTMMGITGEHNDSVGSELGEREKLLLQTMAGQILDIRSYREELQEYVKETMEDIAPTLTALTGPKLGGELIAHAGSLKKLAMMPSSTIQVLGAEKSLFKHLEKGTPPPKHGYILQHPFVHRSAPEVRGKVARMFANKIAIASRIDQFGGEDRGDILKSELKRRIDKLDG